MHIGRPKTTGIRSEMGGDSPLIDKKHVGECSQQLTNSRPTPHRNLINQMVPSEPYAPRTQLSQWLIWLSPLASTESNHVVVGLAPHKPTIITGGLLAWR